MWFKFKVVKGPNSEKFPQFNSLVGLGIKWIDGIHVTWIYFIISVSYSQDNVHRYQGQFNVHFVARPDHQNLDASRTETGQHLQSRVFISYFCGCLDVVGMNSFSWCCRFGPLYRVKSLLDWDFIVEYSRSSKYSPTWFERALWLTVCKYFYLIFQFQVGQFFCDSPVTAMTVHPDLAAEGKGYLLVCGSTLGDVYLLSWRQWIAGEPYLRLCRGISSTLP